MQLSAPIYLLKHQAKRLARAGNLPLHKALDQVASREGYRGWSHLTASAQTGPAEAVMRHLTPGTLLVLAARPGHGKTLLGLKLASEAARLNRRGFVFTLDYHHRDVEGRLTDIGVTGHNGLTVDTSDGICADHIVDQISKHTAPALVIVDYLQLLDQNRRHPHLNDQLGALRQYADQTGTIFALISQIDRSFDLSGKEIPDITDLRQPNPFETDHFDAACFLHNGRLNVTSLKAAP
ncbi:DNA helicase [Yoonia sp. BS5-3]|uniref:DNA helicase n=1 Tax=Yoonia phaeophyticola TaxID=3137369 RepID=A0ABZ2V6U0_9RHOB